MSDIKSIVRTNNPGGISTLGKLHVTNNPGRISTLGKLHMTNFPGGISILGKLQVKNNPGGISTTIATGFNPWEKMHEAEKTPEGLYTITP